MEAQARSFDVGRVVVAGGCTTSHGPVDGGWHGRGGYGYAHHGGGNAGAAIGAGIIGLALGAAIASSQQPYYAPPTYYAPPPAVYYGY